MRIFQYLVAIVGAVLATAGARAVDPVVVELNDRATVGTSLVTVGDVTLLSGGDAGLRATISKLDLAEFKARDRSTAIGRRSVEYRLQLAGIDTAAVRVIGAERVTVIPVRRPVTIEEVIAVARAESLRHTGDTPDLTIDLAVPLVVRLPDVPANDRITITAKPRGKPGTTGRIQMDMTVVSNGETLLAFAIQLDVKSASRSNTGAIVRAGGTVPGMPADGVAIAPNEVLVRARQRVEVGIQSGELKVVMIGESQQDGRLGQTVFVQNPDSKKLIPAKVVGPGKLEVELGGITP